MASKIILKKSSVAGRVPVTDTVDSVNGLAYGELAINYADGKLYYKTSSNTVAEISGSGSGSSSNLTLATTAPVSPAHGDEWINSNTGKKFTYINDGTSSQWVEIETAVNIVSGGGAGVDLSSLSQDILPSTDIAYDLGSATKRWRDLYLSGSTINLGGATIKTDAASGSIALLPKATVADPNPSGVVISPQGGIAVVASTAGEISSTDFTAAVAQAAPAGGGAAAGVFYENSQEVTADYTISSGKNAMTAGPVSIASGVSVTIPTGSRWVIL